MTNSEINLKSSLDFRPTLNDITISLTIISIPSIVLLTKICSSRKHGELYIDFNYKAHSYSKSFYYKLLKILTSSHFVLKDENGYYINQIMYPCIKKREAHTILKTYRPMLNGKK